MKSLSKHKTTKTSKVFIREKETRSRTEGLYETPESPTLRSPELARAQSIVGRERSIDEERIKKLKSIDFANQHTDDQIELAVSILQKEPEDRDTLDLKILMHFTENVEFFKDYDQDTRKQCMREMYHVFLHKGDYCMRQGEYGDTFWVTLKGTVGIKVKTEREIEKNGERVKEKIDLEVASRGAGYAFGHLALLERKPRAATIYCKEDCEFAVLNKAPFQRILSEKEEQRLYAEVNFLKAIKMFSQWSYASIKAFFLLCLPKNYQRGHIVYNQRDKSDHMYIVRSGDFKVSFEAKYQEENKKNRLSDDTEKIRSKFVKSQPTRHVELAIIGPLEIFGFEEMMSGEPRMHTISCISQSGTVLEVKRKDVESTILADSGAAQWLQYHFSSKSKFHEAFIQNMYSTTIPLKGYLLRNKTASSNRTNLSPAHEKPHEINPQILLHSDRSAIYDLQPLTSLKLKNDDASKETLEAQKEENTLTDRFAHHPRSTTQHWKKAFRAKLNSYDPKTNENQILHLENQGTTTRLSIPERVSLDKLEKFHPDRRKSPISAARKDNVQNVFANQPAGLQTSREGKSPEKITNNPITVFENKNMELSPIQKPNQQHQHEQTTKTKMKVLKLNNLHFDAHNNEFEPNTVSLTGTKRNTEKKNDPDFGINVNLFGTSSSRKNREQRIHEYDKTAERRSKSDLPTSKGKGSEFTYEKAVLRKFVNDAVQLGYQMLGETDKINSIENHAHNPMLYNKTISNLRDPSAQRAREQSPRTPVNIHVMKLKQEGFSRGLSRERSLNIFENRHKGVKPSDLSPARQHSRNRSNEGMNPLMSDRYENENSHRRRNIFSTESKNKITVLVKRVASKSLQPQSSPQHSPINTSKPEVKLRDTMADIMQRVTYEVPPPIIKKQEIILPTEKLKFNWLLDYSTPSEAHPSSDSYRKLRTTFQSTEFMKKVPFQKAKHYEH